MKFVRLNKDTLKEIGYRETYDLEIDDKNHNFLIENGIVTSNSHSTAYAMNAYISQWLKVHYPKEYYSVLLNNSTLDDISTYMKQAALAGIEFGGCCFGECSDKFEVDYDKNIIKFGLSSVKGIRMNDITEINEFDTFDGKELIRFIINKKINKKTIEILSRLGFFKKIISPNFYFTEQLIFKLKSSRIQDFDDDYDEFIKYADKFVDYTESEKAKAEKDYLGFYFSDHPFTQYYSKLMKSGKAEYFTRPKDIEEVSEDDKSKIHLIGLVSEIKMLKGKKSGKEYYKLVVEDDEQQINITIFDGAAINNVHVGDIIGVDVNVSSFGITKNKFSVIRVIKSSISNIENKLKSFDEVVNKTVSESWF